ncbi:hypothetical protein OIU34_02685 [Pararhizobium sp. BT-229]|uniref:hypothetical protein n=1 Tax=Pararhizobium sp. BT-229 TaxID=2986923 RepID=UPI0021F73458|nr:hypothetical protein [Pararhizobium sp. BT-229]MCV9960795.1 hypothetical protein [Pararhizobium sp. BT-229]
MTVDIAQLVADLRTRAKHRADFHNIQPHCGTFMDVKELPEWVAADLLEAIHPSSQELVADDVFAVTDGGNSITLHFSEVKSARALRDAFPAAIVSLPRQKRETKDE